MKTKYRFEERENTELQDENVLLNIYLGLVQGVIDGIGTVSKDYRNLNKEFLLGHMCSKFQPVF